VAGCDLRPEIREQWGKRFGVEPPHLYEDYKEMIAAEQPDILSVATQPEHRAAIVIYAAEHGVKAIYAEKALAASLEEANAIAAACAANDVALNMGTNRRYGSAASLRIFKLNPQRTRLHRHRLRRGARSHLERGDRQAQDPHRPHHLPPLQRRLALSRRRKPPQRRLAGGLGARGCHDAGGHHEG